MSQYSTAQLTELIRRLKLLLQDVQRLNDEEKKGKLNEVVGGALILLKQRGF